MIDRMDIVVDPVLDHHAVHGRLLLAGLQRHGVRARLIKPTDEATAPTVACWGWRIGSLMQFAGKRVLVMERGYIGDRMAWTSLGWDGLNGRARFPLRADPDRFEQHHAALYQAWNPAGQYALIIGQVEGDAALAGVRIGDWYAAQAHALAGAGYTPLFRPHPVSVQGGDVAKVPGARRIDRTRTLADCLAAAALVVTYNSTAGVEAALAGKPLYVEDPGSMAFDVAAHDLLPLSLFESPARRAWAERLAWAQWTRAELEDGTAWATVREVADP